MEHKEVVIRKIINEIDNDQLLLPNFQRDFDWDHEKQRSLIASLFYDIPIGGMLLLEIEEADMVTKKIGYKEVNSSEPDRIKRYLMDGQQRLTTLKGVFDDFFKEESNKMFDNLYNNLKNRWFFTLNIFDKESDKIDESKLKIILDLIYKEEISDDRSLSDIKDLIVQQKIKKTKSKEQPFHPNIIKKNPEDFKAFLIKNQYIALFLFLSTIGKDRDRKYQEMLKEPTKEIFKNKWFDKFKKNEEEKNTFLKILKEYNEFVNLEDEDQIEERSKEWADRIYDTLREFLTEKRKLSIFTYKGKFVKAVEAFTAMNTGGLPLSTFDIVVAKYSALRKEQLLKDRISDKFENICNQDNECLPKIDTNKLFDHFTTEKDTSEKKKFYNAYLNMLCVFSKENSGNDKLGTDKIKEKYKLHLTKDEIDKNTDKAVTSIALAFRFLSSYCGVRSIKDISYELMILPIAKNLYDKYENKSNLTQSDIFKILHWYWSSIFGGRYREKQNIRSIEDIGILCKLLKNKNTETFSKNRDKIFDDHGYSDFDSLKNKDSTTALEDSILQFILANSVLNERLSNSKELIKKLSVLVFEKSHLISLNDYNKKKEEQKVKRGHKHHINSVLNLFLLSKENNRLDSTQSWYSWHTEDLKEYKTLIPEKINNMTWENFSKEAKEAKEDNFEELYSSFIKSRFDEIKKAVEDRLNYFENNW